MIDSKNLPLNLRILLNAVYACICIDGDLTGDVWRLATLFVSCGLILGVRMATDSEMPDFLLFLVKNVVNFFGDVHQPFLIQRNKAPRKLWIFHLFQRMENGLMVRACRYEQTV